MKRIAIALVFGLPLLAAGVAIAEQLQGIGATYWMRKQAVTSEACIIKATGSTDCALFPAGTDSSRQSAVVVTTDAAARCCWVGTATGALTLGTDGEIADASSLYDGPGACFALAAAGSIFDGKPNRKVMVDKIVPGIRLGICSVADDNAEDSLYATCGSAGECSGVYGGGTCTAQGSVSSTQIQQVGLFLRCESDSGTANITVRKEIVEKY